MFGKLINICQYYDQVFYPGEKFLIADEGKQNEWLENRKKKGTLTLPGIIDELNDGGCIGYLKGKWRLICREDWEKIQAD